ncbi:hypothetical protein HPB47_026367 [Ixodes persulcatus]|uniref:Uncharacterized protein n=1 Tax=Ixodes persulcatus TaxID=34615 RepID=A0AC60PYX7_IXOPE|nr:hypothetical protein HPB47_026367 [Ixodes persulcatus]
MLSQIGVVTWPCFVRAVRDAALGSEGPQEPGLLQKDKPATSSVVNRNHLLHAEMDAFASFIRSRAPTYRDVINYLDRIADFGVFPEAS